MGIFLFGVVFGVGLTIWAGYYLIDWYLNRRIEIAIREVEQKKLMVVRGHENEVPKIYELIKKSEAMADRMDKMVKN